MPGKRKTHSLPSITHVICEITPLLPPVPHCTHFRARVHFPTTAAEYLEEQHQKQLDLMAATMDLLEGWNIPLVLLAALEADDFRVPTALQASVWSAGRGEYKADLLVHVCFSCFSYRVSVLCCFALCALTHKALVVYLLSRRQPRTAAVGGSDAAGAVEAEAILYWLVFASDIRNTYRSTGQQYS